MICHEKIVIFVSSVAIIVITKLAFDWFRRSLTRSSIFRAIFDLPKVQVSRLKRTFDYGTYSILRLCGLYCSVSLSICVILTHVWIMINIF